MTRPGMLQRLSRLEETAGGGVPLYIRRWLGEALTSEQIATAAAEWETMRALPAADPATFSPDASAWLAARGAA